MNMTIRRLHYRYLCYVVVIFLMLLVDFEIKGQGSEVDIVEKLKTAPINQHDSLNYELFRLTLYDNLPEARKYGFRAYNLSKRYNHKELLAKACRGLGLVYHRMYKPDSASLFYEEGIEVASRNGFQKLLVYIYNDYGRLFESQDVYDSALRYYNLSLENAVSSGLEEDRAFALNNIGLVFYYLRNFEESLNYLLAAVEIKKKLGLNNTLNLLNVALVYNDQGRYNEAIKILNEVEISCIDGCSDNALADLYFDLGIAHYSQSEIEKAFNYFVKTFEIAKRSNNKKKIAWTYYYFALFKIEKKDYKSALEDLVESDRITSEIKLRRLQRDIYVEYIKIYQAQNDLPKVVEYQTKYAEVKDLIFNEQMASNLKDIQLDAQRKQSDVIIQQKDTEIERVRLITTLIGVITVLLVVVTILIYRNYRVSHRMKGILEKEIEKRTGELVKSNADLTQMTQEYDQLVYRASHDIRGPLATLMGLTNIAKQDYEEPLRVRDYLSKIESTANGLNQTLSQLMETNRIRNLPICIEEVDMNELLDEAYSSFKTLNHFPLISLRIEKGDWKNPLLSDKNLIGFILTKLLDNAFRYFAMHSQEKYIKVSWSQEDDRTTISVEDNGLGINAQAKEKIFQLFYVASDVHGSGLGLFLAQMAANRLGGRIILARSSGPTIFKLIISTNLAKAQVEDRPLMTVSG